MGTFVAWPALLVRIGASAPPSFLKMDVEGFEYDVLGTMLESAEARPIVSRPLLRAKSRKLSQKVEPTLEVVRAQSAQDRILAGFGVIRFHRHPYLRLGEARAAAAAIGTRDPLQNALPRAAVVWAVCTPTLAVCALPPSLSSNPKYTAAGRSRSSWTQPQP